jgi:hypothetical protein
MTLTASILLQSVFATGIYNLDSSRFQTASLDTRTEGWTESWGGRDDVGVADATKTGASAGEEKQNTKPNYWEVEDISIGHLLTTPHPQLPIVLTQHRPAWLEQMVLQMARIPYIVLNSTHISNEATGQLPYLIDYHQQGTSQRNGSGGEQASTLPVLVGRFHPTNLPRAVGGNQNSILLYLTEYRMVDLDADALKSEHQRGLSQAFLNMIQSELGTILFYLRYEDHDAWEQVYRKQYIQASLPPVAQVAPENTSWILQLRGRFQASMERAVQRRRLVEYSRGQSVERAVGQARMAYESLERQLEAVMLSSGPNQQIFLLGTDCPALVDAALWAHLADALCDLHLVVVLASFPRLVQYFLDLYQTYFSPAGSGLVDTWEEWNERQNMSNAFQKIPVLRQPTRMAHKPSTFIDAIDLMQHLSLQKQDLQEVLGTVKAKRDSEPWPTASKPTEKLLYRWRMGEALERRHPEKEENPLRKKLLRDQIRNDQMWISGVAGVSVVALLLLQAGAGGPD